MLNWIRGKITRMVVEQKVSQFIAILNNYSKLCRNAVKPAFIVGAEKGLEIIPTALDRIVSDETRLIRLAETWLPVFESAKIAWDLSKEDFISIAKDIKPIITELESFTLPEEIITAANTAVKDLNASVTEFTQ